MSNQPTTRHYEIDALRVVALTLLILYHIFVSYQPFAGMLQFIQYEDQLERYWFIGDLLNIWRIPVLFVISGMAVGFILNRRTVKELVSDRMLRMVPPLVFCTLVIFPTFPILNALYLGEKPFYLPSPGHLWFVHNLVSYTILLLPLVIWVKKRPQNFLIQALRKTLPVSLFVMLPLPLMLETSASGVSTDEFAFFPTRFWFGFLCYGVGFLFPCLGELFWKSIRRVCHLALPLAVLFYLGRVEVLDRPILQSRGWSTAFESAMWMVAFLGYGSIFLNRPSSLFGYLNKAVFPIYIVHMPVQQLVAFFLFRVGLPGELTFFLHVIFTLVLCFLVYEFVIRRIKFLYPVLGLKLPAPEQEGGIAPVKSSGWMRFGRSMTLYVLAPLVVLVQLGIVFVMLAQQLSGSGAAHEPAPNPSASLWMAALNNDVERLQYFLDDGEVEIDQLDPVFKQSPLHLAALNGSTESARILIEAGADTELRTEDQSTPLSHAAFMGRAEIVALLIEEGVEINPVNRYRSTPLDSTEAPWSMVLGVARMMGLTVDREGWEAGRLKARKFLREAGGEREWNQR
ncbi:MAG: acyltransferase family protein [Verrucomicrobiota bacterium]